MTHTHTFKFPSKSRARVFYFPRELLHTDAQRKRLRLAIVQKLGGGFIARVLGLFEQSSLGIENDLKPKSRRKGRARRT